jgi:hypothetical protein
MDILVYSKVGPIEGRPDIELDCDAVQSISSETDARRRESAA